MESVGNRIKRLRKALGFTQAKLATKLGIKAPSVVQWESDKTNLSGENLLSAAKVLGVTPDYLLYGDPQAEPSIANITPTSAAIGATIRALRKQRNMTILELATAIDSDVGNISRLERDVQNYTPQWLAKIAGALQVDIADLFSSPHRSIGIEGNTWHELAKSRMKDLGLSQARLAEMLGVTQGSIGHWLNKYREPSLDMMMAMLSALGISHISFNTDGSLRHIEHSDKATHPKIPLLDDAQVVAWTGSNDIPEGSEPSTYLSTDLNLGPRAFAFQINEDSMTPEFTKGDLILIDPKEHPHPGDFVVAKNGSKEVTFKKYRPRGYTADGTEILELAPLNDDYPCLNSTTSQINIIGTMVEHRRRRKRR